jgi:hypothetical protein
LTVDLQRACHNIYITLLEDGTLGIQEEDGHKIPLVSELVMTQYFSCQKKKINNNETHVLTEAHT